VRCTRALQSGCGLTRTARHTSQRRRTGSFSIPEIPSSHDWHVPQACLNHAPRAIGRRASGALRLTVLESVLHACATQRLVAMRRRRPCKRATVRSMLSPTWLTKQQQPSSCTVWLLLTFPVPATGRRGLLHSAPPPRSSRKKSSSSCISFSGLRSSSRRERGSSSAVES
jgi:hypothetical protein